MTNNDDSILTTIRQKNSTDYRKRSRLQTIGQMLHHYSSRSDQVNVLLHV